LLPTPLDAGLVIPSWTGNEYRRADGTRPTIRTLTPLRFDPERGELDLEIVMHDNGILPRWAAAARPRVAEIAVSGPARGFVPPPDATGFVLGGDETAIPAITQILAAIPAAAATTAVIEVATSAAEVDIAGADVQRVVQRHGAAPGDGLVAGVRRAVSAGLDDRALIWVAGEAASVQRIRRMLFDDFGVPRSRATIRGYWKHGRSGDADPDSSDSAAR
jgi:NADPH-dependent ferric siderophore reductase